MESENLVDFTEGTQEPIANLNLFNGLDRTIGLCNECACQEARSGCIRIRGNLSATGVYGSNLNYVIRSSRSLSNSIQRSRIRTCLNDISLLG